MLWLTQMLYFLLSLLNYFIFSTLGLIFNFFLYCIQRHIFRFIGIFAFNLFLFEFIKCIQLLFLWLFWLVFLNILQDLLFSVTLYLWAYYLFVFVRNILLYVSWLWINLIYRTWLASISLWTSFDISYSCLATNWRLEVKICPFDCL